VFFDSIWIT